MEEENQEDGDKSSSTSHSSGITSSESKEDVESEESCGREDPHTASQRGGGEDPGLPSGLDSHRTLALVAWGCHSSHQKVGQESPEEGRVLRS